MERETSAVFAKKANFDARRFGRADATESGRSRDRPLPSRVELGERRALYGRRSELTVAPQPSRRRPGVP